MAAALPPVTDCCSCFPTSGGGGGGGAALLTGIANPNDSGLIPDDPAVWQDYLQLADAITGPPITRFTWNPNLQTWQ